MNPYESRDSKMEVVSHKSQVCGIFLDFTTWMITVFRIGWGSVDPQTNNLTLHWLNCIHWLKSWINPKFDSMCFSIASTGWGINGPQFLGELCVFMFFVQCFSYVHGTRLIWSLVSPPILLAFGSDQRSIFLCCSRWWEVPRGPFDNRNFGVKRHAI